MKVKVKQATGVLAELLATIDEKELARTRKRMMLAAKIGDAMKRRGYNQVQLARIMKKSTTVISEWLSGDRNFTTDTLTDIEEALGIRLLDVTLMTVIDADTEISQKISVNSKKSAALNSSGSWDFSATGEDYVNQQKYA